MKPKLFDAHLHIIDPAYPLIQNEGYLPEPYTVNDYLLDMKAYHVAGGAVVSGSFQGYDQSYLTDALASLGPGFAGVTQLPPETPSEEILRLHKAGVRAVRFNIKRGGRKMLEQMEDTALHVYDTAGWHAELYIDAVNLPELLPVLRRLPAVSIDHLGLTEEGLPDLLRFVEQGGRVKASGFGRGNLDVKKTLISLYDADPEALMFGSDLPSTRAPRPFQHEDVQLIIEALGNEDSRKVLYDNAASWYKKKS